MLQFNRFEGLCRGVVVLMLVMLSSDIHQHVVYAAVPTPIVSPPIAPMVETMSPAPSPSVATASAAEPKGGMTPKSAPTPPPAGFLPPALVPLLPPNIAPIVDTICFSGWNTVKVQGSKDLIPLHRLKIGDYVQVGIDEYSQVYSFGHYDHDKESSFVQIQFENGDDDDAALELSSRHLLFTAQNQVKTAAEVMVGDSLRSDQPQQDRIVKSVKRVIRRGVYAPLTKSGSIVVSGVISSNFVKMLDHDVTPASSPSWPNQHHIGKSYMYPYQLFCSLFMKICQNETYYQGYSYYVYHLVQIGKMIQYGGIVASSFIWLLSIPLFSIVYVMELSAFGTLLGAVIWFVTFILRRRSV